MSEKILLYQKEMISVVKKLRFDQSPKKCYLGQNSPETGDGLSVLRLTAGWIQKEYGTEKNALHRSS